MTPHWLSNAAMVARLTRDFRSFRSTPWTAERAVETVRRQLERRHERFLAMVERMIFRHPRSPYLQLMRAAGCELGDVRTLVGREGLEGALVRLQAAGVYVAFDEFKGRRAAVRGSQRFHFAEADFDNPYVRPHIESRTGGARRPGTLLKLEARRDGTAYRGALATAPTYPLAARVRHRPTLARPPHLPRDPPITAPRWISSPP